jgi:uncharacterized pyridoxal phosphate-containing UPF0001 family protein
VRRADELAERLAALEQRLGAACADAGRRRDEVSLVAVTKFHPASDIAVLRDLGVERFGESRDQEARAKAAEVRGRALALRRAPADQQGGERRGVRLGGRVVRPPAPGVVAVGRRACGRARARRAGAGQPGRRPGARRGAAADVPALADAVAAADGLRLAGVMAVAPLGEDPARAFARLAELADRLRQDHPQARELSAGMSDDLEQAVACGSTSVRVGTALLGPRPPALR